MSSPNNDRPQAGLVVLACAQALKSESVGEIDGFKLVRLPCSSKAEPVMILKAFLAGALGVALIPCALGNCRFLEGNQRAQALARGVTGLLEEIGLEKERFALYPLEAEKRGGIIDFLSTFQERIQGLGPWYKG